MSKSSLSTQLLLVFLCLLLSGLVASCDTGGIGTQRRDCVVILGDSIWALTGAEERHLRDISGHRYKTYYMSGTQMQGGVNDIESQYDRAARQGRIRTIIMDGGGNDFLLGGMLTPQVAIREISAAYERIFEKAARDGVKNIIVQGYYKTSSTSSFTDQSESEVRQLTLAAAQKYGLNTAHFDPSDDPWFSSKRPGQYTLIDGIHPTDAASRQLARLVWDTMAANQMEQDEGCQAY